MTVSLDTRSIKSPEATEIHISAVPRENTSPQVQAEEIFSGIRKILHSKKASILQERVFAVQSAMKIVSEVRSGEYGDTDDGVAPSLLVCREGMFGPIAGVQVHAVSSNSKPEVVNLEGSGCGRILRVAGSTRDSADRRAVHLRRAYLTLSGISAPEFDQATEQTWAVFEKAESALKQSGADFRSVARTWMWLRDILSWYGDFNNVRNKFFTKRGIIGEGSRESMPASTGIGLGPSNGGKCAMDLTAVLEPADLIQYLQTVGRQHCAFDYGSAFSRASRAITPAGQTVFVSGTAAIDANGVTTNIGDAVGQINATIENVRAVLKDMNCRDEDVVQVTAYCKTPEVEKIFNELKDRPAWPWVTMICPICRDELLFEIEVSAMQSVVQGSTAFIRT